jgi:hypothetical protein
MLKVLLKHIIIEQAINVLFDTVSNNFNTTPTVIKFRTGDLYESISIYTAYNHNPNNPDAIVGCTTVYNYCEVLHHTNTDIDVFFDSTSEVYHRINGTTKIDEYDNEDGSIHTLILDEIIGAKK